ncbi:PREDICTED: uncharacterized protein LOC109157046 [Ipomoea nil]|uniref:uncharacterized protein LOC109157046 n=1 Tax=Ipomoea nil TaxID=35883 RepID=UPI000900B88B|nr:PREDICTED: uncharacterized protein LOC109157046 [Ipomoea nil]
MVIDDEDAVFEPNETANDVEATTTKPTWRLVGRFLTTKIIKLEFMSQVIASVWQPVMGVQVAEIQPGLFLFVFYHEMDMQLVLDGGSWSFENHTLVCKQVEDGAIPVSIPLDTSDMWVQLHDLPLGFSDALWKTFYCIRVSIPVLKPLKRGMKLLKRDKMTCCVKFKYERLHNFCFFCGMLGHPHRYYLKARKPVQSLTVVAVATSEGPSTGGVTTAVTGGKGSDTVVAASKWRREVSIGGGGGNGGNDGDTQMAEVSKNLSLAGSGSRTRPSS